MFLYVFYYLQLISMPPEKYEHPELENAKIDLKPFKDEMDKLQQNVFVESNLQNIVEESFKYSPVDYRVKEGIFKYIKDWKLKTGENQEYEEYVKRMITKREWRKLKYIYDNADKNMFDVIVAIKKADEKNSYVIEPIQPKTQQLKPKPIQQIQLKPQQQVQQKPQEKPKVQQKPKTQPKPITQPKIELHKEEWLTWVLNGVGDAIWNLADKVTNKIWSAKNQVVDVLWSVYDKLSDWVVSVWADAKDVPSQLVPTLWQMFKEAENWMNTAYKYWWTSKKWIDCSAFVSRLLAIANWWEYVRYTTTTLRNQCKKVPSQDARAGDLQYSNKWGHVEMIVNKPWKEWWKWFVNTLWSANSRPFDESWKRIAHSWPWYRKRALSSTVYRPKVYDKIAHSA